LKRKHSSKDLIDFIINNVEKNPRTITRIVTDEFGISRQAAARHLRNLVDEGVLVSEGRTRDKKYSLKRIIENTMVFNLDEDLEEDRIWRENIKPLLTKVKEIPSNVLTICNYGFTEMFNNVLDHSEAKTVVVVVNCTQLNIELKICDNGIGIFNKIKKELSLVDYREALLELSKGKLTTDPENHSGEGIFFTSRMFDHFSMLSDNLYFDHDFDGDDWLIENKIKETKGTLVTLLINSESARNIQDVFDKYSNEDYDFSKTHVPVLLSSYIEDDLVSRSQAKRLLARFEKFKEVFLDFKGINYIGQAFADEIFRVFKKNHPEVEIIWINTNEEVEHMINRALSKKDDKQIKLKFED